VANIHSICYKSDVELNRFFIFTCQESANKTVYYVITTIK